MNIYPYDFEYVTEKTFDLVEDVTFRDEKRYELGSHGRDYQVVCYNTFSGEDLTVLISATGSGKSMMQMACSIYEIEESEFTRKQAIAVPMRDIARSFSVERHRRLIIKGKEYIWEVGTNCCDDVFNEDLVQRVKKFLVTPAANPGARKLSNCIGVMTHAALLAAFKSMTPEEKDIMFSSTSFRIDEVHKVAGVHDEVDGANWMGQFCKEALAHEGVRLHLTTATYFRGDDRIILSPELESRFKIFRVPFMDHWRTLGLNSLSQGYACYTDAEDLKWKILRAIEAEPNEPCLIYFPSDGQGIFRKVNKLEFVKSFVEDLEKILDGRGRVLDLITPERQKREKKEILTEEQDFHAVVTCRIMQEGSDWPPLSRIYNTVKDNNTLRALQKLGRTLRKYPGKTNIKIFNYIEYFADWDADPDKSREIMSDRFNAVALGSMLIDMFCPIVMRRPARPVRANDDTENDIDLTLEDVYGDLRGKVVIDIARGITAIPGEHRSGDAVDEVIEEVMEAYGSEVRAEVDKEVLRERLRKEALRLFNRDNPALQADKFLVNFIREGGWDKVCREHIGPRAPFIGIATTEDLEHLQRIVAGTDMEQWKANAEELDRVGVDKLERGTDLWRFANRVRAEYNRDMLDSQASGK